MKAIVLCAGPGTRMRPLTDTTPKCMLPVGGKPLLHHTLERLAEAGVTDVAINLHHLPRAIVHDIKRGYRFGLRVTYSYERELLGTAGAIKRLAWWLDEEPFFVVYGDEWTSLDFGDIYHAHFLSSRAATVVTHPALVTNDRNLLLVDWISGIVERIWRKSEDVPMALAYAASGIYVLEPWTWEYVNMISPTDIEADLLPTLLNLGFTLRAYNATADEVIDIGKPEGYARACALAGPSW
ncbi:MAG TPA: nucleotidyltransferase family protein [Anaerolineae bacterium]|nr:nucleotidyltransferase family protein [Anaerolineae bacterium]